MFMSPPSLKDACMDYICANVEALIDTGPYEGSPLESGMDLVYTNKDMFLPQTVSEQLLTNLSKKKKLNDVTMGMFNHKHCQLSEVHLPDANSLSTRGLRKLRQHKINVITAVNMKVVFNDFIGCLGEWTLNNLKFLNVTDCTFLQKQYLFIISSISKLKSLHSLNVQGTEFNDHGLQVVVEDLPCLQHLNLSRTRVLDISILKRLKHQLRYLGMHNLSLKEKNVSTLCELTELRHLDLSIERTLRRLEMYLMSEPFMCPINMFLKQEPRFPHIVSLDLSGNDTVESYLIEEFVRFHPTLKFLGVVDCDYCYENTFTTLKDPEFNPELQVYIR